jgi:hypothetical protein
LKDSTVTFVLQVLQGLLTPLIAVITVYIAWQQWKTNERKLRFDQYDRRLRVYEQVIAFLRLVTRNFRPQIEDLIKFSAATAEADFLFGPEIPTYINEIFSHALTLHGARADYRDFTQALPPGYDHEKIVTELHEQEVWFSQQYEIAKQKFKKYLDIRR